MKNDMIRLDFRNIIWQKMRGGFCRKPGCRVKDPERVDRHREAVRAEAV